MRRRRVTAAWPFYLATGAWVGQENRRFGNAERLGFYSGREVHGLPAADPARRRVGAR